MWPSEPAGPLPIRRAVGVRGVFDQRRAGERPAMRHDRVHVGRLPGEMDRDDGPGARRDRGLDRAGIEVEGIQIDVGEHRHRVGLDDRRCGGQKRVRRNDHLVFGLNAGREQRDSQRNRAIDHGDAVPAAVHRGEALFELCDLRAVAAVPIARCAACAAGGLPRPAPKIGPGGNGRVRTGDPPKRASKCVSATGPHASCDPVTSEPHVIPAPVPGKCTRSVDQLPESEVRGRTRARGRCGG